MRVAELPASVQRRWLTELTTRWYRINQADCDGRLKMPTFTLTDVEGRLGFWEPKGRTISIGVHHLVADTWAEVEETLRHEMAHQVVVELFDTPGAEPHGELFARACAMLRINPEARGEARSPEHQRMVARIQKLLNLATSENEHEAQAAMAQANRLLLKHNIELSEAGTSDGHIYKRIGKPIGRVSTELKMLANLLVSHFFVKVIFLRTTSIASDKAMSMIELIGTPENVELAEYTFDYLGRVLEDLWKKYKRRHGARGSDKASYRVGVVMGFRDHLDAQKVVHQKEGLVWLGDPGLDEFFDSRYPSTSSMRGGTYRPGTALDRGRADGQNVRIRPGMTSSPAPSGGGRLLPGR